MIIQPEQLLYRRQYVLGPESWQPTSFWQQKTLTDGLVLSFHRELNVEQVRDGKRRIILMGYILDPFNPASGNRQILTKLVQTRGFDSFVRQLKAYGGRWILVWVDGGDTRLIHDPVGSREVYYSRPGKYTWCASQPHLLAEILGASQADDNLMQGFLYSQAFLRHEKAWIGDGTPFDNIHHLLPNHYLDLGNGVCRRHWPVESRRTMPRRDAVAGACQVLTGLLEAASRRFRLALAVSGGWDSRVLLAASRSVSGSATYFIQQFGNMTEHHTDIRIPRKLMSKLRTPFRVLTVEDAIDPKFEEVFEESCALYQSEQKKRLHYNYFSQFPGHVFVNGMASGISRCVLRFDGPVNTESLGAEFRRFVSALAGPVEPDDIEWTDSAEAFIEREIGRWLRDAGLAARSTGYNVLDLFHWEQRMGNWGVMYCSNSDVAGEMLLPFNCRHLHEILLGVREKYRRSPHYELFAAMASSMWPETLGVPVNDVPPRGLGKATYRLKYALREETLRELAGGIVARTPPPLLSAYRRMKSVCRN